MNTYVISVGIVPTLHDIAQSGGTDQAYLISTSGNVSQNILNALDDIVHSGECRFDIPLPGSGTPDFGNAEVELVWAANPTQVTNVAHVSSLDDCDPTSGGWTYDDPVTPAVIVLCPASCQDGLSSQWDVRIVVPCQS